MRLSSLIILFPSLIITTVAAPVQLAARNDLDDSFVKSLGDELTSELNATASGVIDSVKQFLANPALTVARIQVVQGLSSTADALDKVSAEANSTGNAGVQNLVTKAQAGLDEANAAVGRIGEAISSGVAPNSTDQKIVAEGIHDTFVAINSMENAVTNQDDTLSSDIQDAIQGVTGLKDGAEGVLAASNKTLADLGLSNNLFDGVDGNDSSADSTGDDTGSDDAGNANDISGNEDTGTGSAGADGAGMDGSSVGSGGDDAQVSKSDSEDNAGESGDSASNAD